MKLNMKCSGCEEELTTQNIGGYRCYCDKCVKVMPPIPRDDNYKGGYYLHGTQKSFRWMKV